jgi:peptidoglycan/LPS O-acetylase OafA/YrhL
MTSTSAHTAARYDHIDALRAIAALLVVWMHVSEVFVRLPGTTGAWAFEWAFTVNFGRIGVALFFIVSGFVIPSSLKSSEDRWGELGRFAIKRFFRLYPLFWLSIPLGLVTTWWLFGKSLSPAQVLANVTMIPGFLGAPYVEGLYWTLEVELIFYLACAALFVAGLLHSTIAMAIIATTLSAAFLLYFLQDIMQIGGPPLLNGGDALWVGHIGIMVTGTLLRRWHDGELSPPLRGIAIALIGAWGIALPLVAVTWHFAVPDTHGELLRYGCGYGLAMALFALGAFVIRLNTPALAWCGRISYSLYLLHPVVFYATLYVVETGTFGPAPALPLIAWIILAVALSIAVSALSYRYVEMPMNALGARLARPRASNATVPAY